MRRPERNEPAFVPEPYAPEQFNKIAAAVRELEHPRQIGPYFVLEQIGEGGMGSVYRAEQRSPIRRVVAIKIIKLGMDTREVISRFEAERQVLALMDHPNVARVIDAGATAGGSPYFVMECVLGESITAFADRHTLPLRARLELFIQACDAVQHAHQKGIIHRDLKPSNILVTLDGDTPRVKVIDFGIAKAINPVGEEGTRFTVVGKFIGTPEYMAPEQADNDLAADVDTRSDVYSLGIVLYELLTGSLPFDAKSFRGNSYNEIKRLIRESDPPRPSTRLSSLGDAGTEIARLRRTPLDVLERQLKNELEWIPLKAMRKERAERYGTATELVDDIRNYLADRPLRAAPETRAYRMRIFIRRNRRAIAVAALVLIVLVAGLIATTWQAHRANVQSALVAKERDNAKAVLDFFTDSVIGAADPSVPQSKHVDRDVLDKAAAEVDKSFGKQPVVEAVVRLSISDTYRSLGLLDKALPFSQKAYEIRRQQFGDDNFETIVALSRYANILIDMQRAADAEPLVRRILEATTRMKGANDPETLAAQTNVANVLCLLGRYADAKPYLRQHYEVLRKLRGEEDRETLAAKYNYAAVTLLLGELHDAEPLLRQTYNTAVKRTGEEDPTNLEYANALGTLLSQLGQQDEACSLMKKTFELRQHVLGPDHPDTINTGKTYADILLKLDRADDALGLLKGMVEKVQVAHPDSPPSLGVMNMYANALSAQKRFADALPIRREVYEKRKAILSENHPDTLIAMLNYSTTLSALGRDAEAEPFSRGAFEGMSKQLGPNHISTITAETKRAALLLKMKRPADAEPLAKHALEEFGKLLGASHASTLVAAQTYIDVLTALNRPDDAARVSAQFPTTAPTKK